MEESFNLRTKIFQFLEKLFNDVQEALILLDGKKSTEI